MRILNIKEIGKFFYWDIVVAFAPGKCVWEAGTERLTSGTGAVSQQRASATCGRDGPGGQTPGGQTALGSGEERNRTKGAGRNLRNVLVTRESTESGTTRDMAAAAAGILNRDEQTCPPDPDARAWSRGWGCPETAS